MKSLALLLGVAVAAAAAGLGFIYSGLADVAATSPHWAVTEWVLSTTMANAVRSRAADLSPPPFAAEGLGVRAGIQSYDAMCVTCHGAPGVNPGPFAEGLNPPPPKLVEEAEEWSLSELFWITKHGVRMTGMPAFGPTHSDDELWELSTAVARLPELSPEEYRALSDDEGEPEQEDEHEGSRDRDAHGHSGHSH